LQALYQTMIGKKTSYLIPYLVVLVV